VTPGDLELAQLVVSWGVNLSAAAAVILRDERRLAGDALARAWPPASRMAAIFVFSPLCVVVHFARTRRLGPGLAVGVAWVAAIVAADQGLQRLTAAAVDRLGL